MKFKDLDAEHEWEQTVAEAPKHDKMVSEAIAFFVNWVAAMETHLNVHPHESDADFHRMVEICMIEVDQDLSYKQLVWILTWVKRVWLHGDRIVTCKLF